MTDSLLVRTLNGEKQARVPFWFMRQAGRYLEEYRALRHDMGGFLDLCYHPDNACEVTLQPIRRFDMDAAIIFSDILVVPHALGANVRFVQGEGPRIDPVNTVQSLDELQWNPDFLRPVYDAITRTRAELAEEKALIGFAGAPWTLACYMVQGQSDRDFTTVRQIALTQPRFFDRLMQLLTDCVIAHLVAQIDAGAQVVQVFDSWAGVLNAEEFARYSIAPAAAIVAAIHAKRPGVPVIGFPRGAGVNYLAYVKQTQVDAVSIDYSVPIEWAAEILSPLCVVQGNLDPLLLADDKAAMLAQARRIVDCFSDKVFVFNLGHGIVPRTPVAHMQALCEYLRFVRC